MQCAGKKKIQTFTMNLNSLFLRKGDIKSVKDHVSWSDQVDQFVTKGGKGKSACNGDSGGPLVCQGEDSKWYQVENWASVDLKANTAGLYDFKSKQIGLV